MSDEVTSRKLNPWITRMAVFLGLCLATVVFIQGLPLLFLGMSRVVPENYRYLAREAMDRKQYDRAEEILRERIEKQWYDFEAHYLLAEAQDRAGKSLDAAETMRSVQTKSVAVRGRVRANEAGYSGYDEAKTVQLLARYLWRSQNYLAAAEVWRHAMDLGSSVVFDDVKALPAPDSATQFGEATARGLLAIHGGDGAALGLAVSRLSETNSNSQDVAAYLRSRWLLEKDRDSTAAKTILLTAMGNQPDRILPVLALRNLLEKATDPDPTTSMTVANSPALTTARQALLHQFSLPNGTTLDRGSLRMVRNGKVTGRCDTGMFQSDRILLSVSGSVAYGQWPVLIVRVNGVEASRLYLDGPQPGLRFVGPFPGGLPKVLDLEFEFVNDTFDPVSRSDRDIQIHGIWFQ